MSLRSKWLEAMGSEDSHGRAPVALGRPCVGRSVSTVFVPFSRLRQQIFPIKRGPVATGFFRCSPAVPRWGLRVGTFGSNRKKYLRRFYSGKNRLVESSSRYPSCDGQPSMRCYHCDTAARDDWPWFELISVAAKPNNAESFSKGGGPHSFLSGTAGTQPSRCFSKWDESFRAGWLTCRFRKNTGYLSSGPPPPRFKMDILYRRGEARAAPFDQTNSIEAHAIGPGLHRGHFVRPPTILIGFVKPNSPLNGFLGRNDHRLPLYEAARPLVEMTLQCRSR